MRVGPPHVGLTGTAEMSISLLEVRNCGRRFGTVTANCTVYKGMWYYEVTLLSCGLMQIGWAASTNVSKPEEGVGVGDTTTSWSIDLFRRVRWHNGVPTRVAAPRRWVPGDVIGCAIDLEARQMRFSVNGSAVVDTSGRDVLFEGIDNKLGFCPAASLRAENACGFNFGSTSLRYKPDGYQALGVADTWFERIDTFYSFVRPSAITRRITSFPPLQGPGVPFYSDLRELVDGLCEVQKRNVHQMDFVDRSGGCMELWNKYPSLSSLPQSEIAEHISRLKSFNRAVQSIIPLINVDRESVESAVSTVSWLRSSRPLVFSWLREQSVSFILKETEGHGESVRLVLNRIIAAQHKQDPSKDPTGSSSMFGQTFTLLSTLHPRIFKTSQRFWTVVFGGEGAEDAGGPFREHLSMMCSELMSKTLPLFVPTANNAHNVGTHREAFVPAASANQPLHLSMFAFVGRIMGGALRSGEPLSLFLPPLVWKYLTYHDIVDGDLALIDELCAQCVQQFRAMGQHGDEAAEMFNETFATETFVTQLSDGTVVPLLEGGETQAVTFDRCAQYAKLVSEKRLHECDAQLEAMRRGLISVVPQVCLTLLSPEELERKVCGSADFVVSELKESTTFEGLAADDRRVLFLWTVLEAASVQQRRAFLRFVSGRERLPVKLRILPMPTQGDPSMMLPRAATCFFALELPDYPSAEVLRDRLFYAITNCVEIDTDFRAAPFDEQERPQLLMGVDETRREDDPFVAHDETP